MASTEGPPPDPDVLPANVDPRQATLFGAAWTLGSLAQLAAAGADSATYYETLGPRGVVEGAAPAPAPFVSRPHGTFPLYHVLADAAALRGGGLLACMTDDQPWLAGLAVRDGGGAVVLVANLLDMPRAVRLTLPGATSRVRVRVLDEETAVQATVDPAAFRADARPVHVRGGEIELLLGPYATARVRAD